MSSARLGDFRLRAAEEGDVPALAALHVAAFRETHGGGPSAELRESQWREKFRAGSQLACLVVEADERLVGFASCVERSEEELPEFLGELNKIYLLREVQGLGLGKLLLRSAMAEFVRHGIHSMILFGDARSPSNGFYEHMGGERLFSRSGEFHGAYGWRKL